MSVQAENGNNTKLQSGFRSTVDLLASFAMIGAAIVLVWRVLSPAPQGAVAPRPELVVPDTPVELLQRPAIGGQNAQVVLLTVSEFQCPFCAKFATETFPELRTRYVDPGRVLVAFRHLPLQMHQFAREAAEVAECAERRGTFWRLHDLLFTQQKELSSVTIRASAASLGVSEEVVNECKSNGVGSVVDADMKWAKDLNVNGTPAFFFGLRDAAGKMLVKEAFSGARPLEAFVEVLERLLKAR
jgi:protein-disulfide isomerase